MYKMVNGDGQFTESDVLMKKINGDCGHILHVVANNYNLFIIYEVADD